MLQLNTSENRLLFKENIIEEDAKKLALERVKKIAMAREQQSTFKKQQEEEAAKIRIKREEEIEAIRKQEAIERKKFIEEANLREEFLRMERFERSGEIFRVAASFQRDHNGNERSRVAFPGCIPLEQAIRLRAEGRFYEPDYYDAEKWKSQFD